MIRVEDVVATAAALAADGRGRFRASAMLQSWPGIVHGGGLVALLAAAASPLVPGGGRRAIEGRLTSPVPTETDLALEANAGDGTATASVVQAGTPLTSVSVRPLGDGAVAATASSLTTGSSPTEGGGLPLPVSEQCLACGAANPIGLQAGLRFDEHGVWARLVPPAPWATRARTIHPAVAPVLLDEVAWWLGALTMREGGLTNRIAIAVEPGAFPEGALIAAGRFEDVAPVDRRRTFWRTICRLSTEAGMLLATADIVFRGGPDYSARQIPYFRARCAPTIFARMFPNHAR